MTDLIKRLRIAARKACERHNNVDQFDPAWERKPKDFIEWEAADRIEQLEEIADTNYVRYREQTNRIGELLAHIEQLEATLSLISNPGDVTDAEELGWIAREALERIG